MSTNAQRVLTIECKDVILREFLVEDVDAIYNLTQQPHIIEFLPEWSVSKEQRLNWLTNYETVENRQFIKAVADGGDVGELRLRLGVILKETVEFIGWCYTGIKEELPAPNREIAYAISKQHANKGYTTQAAIGMINYLFENTNVEELSAVAMYRNASSNRVIQKCGFVPVNDIVIKEEAYHSYKLYKADWQK
ncbi:GNAT family N-acetyltransferase [Brevibacillus reuszeri]|uniref:GNAT family N-acetyltransferase n=1 Tax=Brevibacillus reuszeri TaxID=54915 RepID=UPI002795B5AC|nr:GNAT family N-acetyltransferase [Brevibacillus reuszeri]